MAAVLSGIERIILVLSQESLSVSLQCTGRIGFGVRQ